MLNYFLFLFLGTGGWGISLFLIKVLLVSLTPMEIVLYRVLIGAIALIFLVKQLKLEILNWKNLLIDGCVIGIFNMVLPFYLTTLAERTVSSALASVLNGLTPLCTFLLTFCFFPKRKNWSAAKFSSLALGILGMILIHVEAFSGEVRILDLLALVAACFSYAVAAIYVKSSMRTQEPLLVSAMAATVSSLLMLALQFYFVPRFNWSWPVGWMQIGSLLWLGVVGSGLSLYLYCLLIKRTGSVFASMITYLMAATGVFFGILFLKETMSTLVILGCLVICFSLILMNHGDKFYGV